MTYTTTETTTIEYDDEGRVARQVVVTAVETKCQSGVRRLAVDADGFVWWVNDDDTWSMARINPDNSPIPQPVTYYEPVR